MEFGITTLGKYVNPLSARVLASLNAPWIRLNYNASIVGSVASGFTNWAQLDGQIAYFASLGCNIIVVLQHFANSDLDPTCGLPTPAALNAYGTLVIQRYGTMIKSVEICNEEPAFASGACRNASVYAAIVQAVYPVLKPLNSNLTIGGFGYTNYSGSTGNNGDPGYWYGQFFAADGALYVDRIQIHYYNGGHDPTVANPGGAPPLLAIIDAIDAQMETYGVNLPISVGEFGWQANPSTPQVSCPNDIGDALQAAYLIKAVQLLKTRSSVSHAIFYTADASDAGFYDCHDVLGHLAFGLLQEFFLDGGNFLSNITDSDSSHVTNAYVDGQLTVGSLLPGLVALLGTILQLGSSGAVATPTGAAQTIATTSIINRTAPAGACTAAVLQAGTQNGQLAIVTNESTVVANTITFNTTVATGFVLTDATPDAIVIKAASAAIFIWLASLNSGAGAWVHVGPFAG